MFLSGTMCNIEAWGLFITNVKNVKTDKKVTHMRWFECWGRNLHATLWLYDRNWQTVLHLFMLNKNMVACGERNSDVVTRAIQEAIKSEDTSW